MTLRFTDAGVAAGGTVILQDVSVCVAPGDCVALVGPNGAGKSTMLRAALGLVRLSHGSATINDVPARTLAGRDRAAAMGWLPQHGTIREPVEVLDFVTAARFRFAESRSDAKDKAHQALHDIGLQNLEKRHITTLSGGELQRVMMATLIAQDPSLFLLDEPANHLDPAHQLSFYGRIADQWQSGRGVLVVTHDINLLAHLAPPTRASEVRVVGLRAGRKAFETPLNDPGLGSQLSELFGIGLQTLDVGGRTHFVPTGDSS